MIEEVNGAWHVENCTVPLGRGIARKVVRLAYVEVCIIHHGFLWLRFGIDIPFLFRLAS